MGYAQHGQNSDRAGHDRWKYFTLKGVETPDGVSTNPEEDEDGL